MTRGQNNLLLLIIGLLSIGASYPASAEDRSRPPNILFIAIDDLNDWVGFLGGHPQVKTPNMDRLAARGTVFSNAHCAAPLCGPSRAAIFSGLLPTTTGIYENGQNIQKKKPGLVYLPQYFSENGYSTFGTGKLLHKGGSGLFEKYFSTEQRWSPLKKSQVSYTREELPSKGSKDPHHAIKAGGKTLILPLNRMPSDRAPNETKGESFDWGPFDIDDDEMGDGKITAWACERLLKKKDKPFFLAVGYYRPHIPLFAPRKYFEVYPESSIALPPTSKKDLDDLETAGRKTALEAVTAGAHATVLEQGQWRAAVRAYLACVTFVDAQVGRILEALEKGPHAGNTLVVLWSDHGWHLGEKQHWGKWTGWERSTRVPLLVAPAAEHPDAKKWAGQRCSSPVSLVDLYPTLVELAGLPKRAGLDGRSLKPLLENPRSGAGRAVVTTFGKGRHSIRSGSWRLIRYEDGTRELYNLGKDPNEGTNLAGEPEHSQVEADLAAKLP
ncbi:MAG: sulfatase [Planctomycetota bacterium]|nr:sulfatase [Planctomycetota bacterium]